MIEALQWLKSTPGASIAGNRFSSAEEAERFISKLYDAGALDVSIDEEKLIRENYAETFVVTLPADPNMRAEIFDIYREEQREFGDEFGGDDGGEDESVEFEDEDYEEGEELQDREQLTLTFLWD